MVAGNSSIKNLPEFVFNGDFTIIADNYSNPNGKRR
jgi:hypothetical protein